MPPPCITTARTGTGTTVTTTTATTTAAIAITARVVVGSIDVVNNAGNTVNQLEDVIAE